MEINITKQWIGAQADINFVCGYICSGKNRFCKQFKDTHEHIVVSDIVRSIVMHSTRAELQDTKDLADQIVIALVEKIDRPLLQGKKVLVDGIRQASILWALKQQYKDDFKLSAIWLECDLFVLKKRYANRAALKDAGVTFEEAFEKDLDLGLDEVEDLIKKGDEKMNSIIIKHHIDL